MTVKSKERPHRIGMKHRVWPQETLDNALHSVRSGVMSAFAASKNYGIPKSTIADYIRKNTDKVDQIGRKSFLSNQQEIDLCNYIGYMADRGFPMTISQILLIAWCIDRMSGKSSFGENGPRAQW